MSQRTLSFLVAALLLAPISTFAAAVDTTTEAQGAVPVQLPAPADDLPTLPPVKPLLEQAAPDAEELPAVPAIPESSTNIFLLQLGAFPSEAMASDYWSKLKEKHSELLGDLELKIAPVALPPDNKTVYRTQAGSIASRDKAQSICARLRSTGADCFIVESVPGAPASAPVIQEAKAEDAALPVLPDPDQRRAPSDQDKPWETVTAEAPAPAEPPKPVEASKNDAPAVPVQLSAPEPLAVPDLPAPPPATAQAAPEVPREAAKPEMAWLNEPAAQTPPPAPKPEAAKPARGAKTKTVKAPKPQPNRTIVASPDSPTVRTLDGGLAASSAPRVTPIPPRMPQEFTPAPPPPAPDYAASQPHDIAPQATAAAIAETPAQDDDGKGEVNVAEAIRVPLSQETQPVPGKLVYRVMPSDPQRTRTQWLDIGAFASESQAIGYWNDLRATYAKHISGLRVRVTRPFMNPGRTSLRVGPLSSETDTASICTVATEQGLRCQVVTDLGVSSSSTRGGTRVSRDTIAQDTYYRGQAQAARTPMSQSLYWVQLGTFASEGEAMHNWSGLQSANGELLGRMQQHVSVPRLSSASRQAYRLRTGPFIQRFAAAELCDNLRRRAVSCVTVQGN